MKTRLGFVSNSSSSSFIVGVKGNLTFDKDSIVEALGVPKESLLRPFAEKLAHFIVENVELVTPESILDSYGYENFEEARRDGIPEAELIEKGYEVYSMQCSYNESNDALETFIGNDGLADIETDTLAFWTVHE